MLEPRWGIIAVVFKTAFSVIVERGERKVVYTIGQDEKWNRRIVSPGKRHLIGRSPLTVANRT